MKIKTHKILTFLIALVWLINGIYAKVLGFVTRHEEIVARILGDEYSLFITKSIGIAEVFMAIWVLSRIQSRLNAATQILLILLMNVLEFSIARDLLLWGGMNFVFASIFAVIVYYNEFVLGNAVTET